MEHPHTHSDGYVHASDGTRLYYRQDGDGDCTTVVLHSGPAHHLGTVAPDLSPLFADERPLLYYDQRGSGRSDLLSLDALAQDASAHAQDLHAVRELLDADRVDLVALTWGGVVAAQYAATFPEDVRSMVLVSPYPVRRTPHMEALQGAIMGQLPEDERARVMTAAEQWIQGENDPATACQNYFGTLLPALFHDADAFSKMNGSPCRAPASALTGLIPRGEAIATAFGDWDWGDELAQAAIPTLIVRGDSDPIPDAAIDEWTDALPDVQVAELERCGYFPHVEQPDAFADAVRAFWSHAAAQRPSASQT